MREEIQNCMHEMKRRLTKESLYQLKKTKKTKNVSSVTTMEDLFWETGLILLIALKRMGPWYLYELYQGDVRLSIGALSACFYKTQAEAWQQGSAPILFKGGIPVLHAQLTLGFTGAPPQKNTDFTQSQNPYSNTYICLHGMSVNPLQGQKG